RVVAAARQHRQVAGGQLFAAAVREDQLAPAPRDDVHSAQAGLGEVQPEPPVPEDGAQQVHGGTDAVVRRTVTHGLSACPAPSVQTCPPQLSPAAPPASAGRSPRSWPGAAITCSPSAGPPAPR